MGLRTRLWVVASLMAVGIVLGALGSFATPLGDGICAFWPALVVQFAGGIWFGALGGLAGALFPIVTNLMIQTGLSGILGFIPANLVQGMLPAWAFRHFRIDPALPTGRDMGLFIIWGALLPSVLGGCLGATSLFLFGEVSLDQFVSRASDWALANGIVAIVLGVPTLRILTPLLREYGLLVSGYWPAPLPPAVRPRSRQFADQPLLVKMLLALGAVGCLPSLSLATMDLLANQGGAPTVFRLSSFIFSLNLFLSLLAAGWLSQWITRPIRNLERNVEALISGREATLSLGQRDEIGRLATSFERLYQTAQAAIHSRDEFIQVASHELRTPLTPLTLRLQRLVRKAQSAPDGQGPDIATDLAMAAKQMQRIRTLVEQVLDVSLLSERGLVLDRRDVDLAEAAQAVVESLSEGVPDGRIILTAPGPAVGCWDRSRVEQVIANLLLNALKFGQGKPIEVTVTPQATQATLVVRDHGIGISPADQARIFAKFERAVSAEHYGGLGLGLYVARQIVEAHGGGMSVASTPGEGATFSLTLPYASPPGGPAPGAGHAA